MVLTGSSAFEQKQWPRHARLRFTTFTSAIAVGFLGTLCLTSAWAGPSSHTKKALRIYFVDVEGGQATLLVTPAKRSLLSDCQIIDWPISITKER